MALTDSFEATLQHFLTVLRNNAARAALFALVLLAIGDNGARAVRAIVPGEDAAPTVSAVAVSNAFTFQGRLSGDGTPPTGAFDLQFALYDIGTVASGTPLGIGILDRADLQVTNGLFTTLLDFGPNAFDGDARWVEVRVRPGASEGAYTTLGRQELTAAPYALVALNFVEHDHLGEDWMGDDAVNPALTLRNFNALGTAFYAEAGRIGVQALASGSNAYGVWGQGDGTGSVGVRGTGLTGVLAEGFGRGLTAYASAASGTAVHAEAGAGFGVYSISRATAYAAVVGAHLGQSCNSGTYGVLADSCIGVFGHAVDGGLGLGVVGYGSVYGVLGRSYNTFGGAGVRGETTDGDSVGVEGVNLHDTCLGTILVGADCAGVSGRTLSQGGIGVAGQGGRVGVWGEPNINVTAGIGIYGRTNLPSQWAGYFDGKVHATGVITSSDARLKRKIGMPAGLAEVLRLHPVTFDWIADDGRSHQGLIAQEVADVLPDLVVAAGIDGEEHLGVAYDELIPVLIRAVQEQQAQIDELRAELDGLR